MAVLGLLIGCRTGGGSFEHGPGSGGAPVAAAGARHDASTVRAAPSGGSEAGADNAREAPSGGSDAGADNARAAASGGSDGGVDDTRAVPPEAGANNLFGLVRSAEDIGAEQEGRAASRDGKVTARVQVPAGGRPRILVDAGDGRGERVLVDLASDATPEPMGSGAPLRQSSGVFSLAFSPDARQLYFQADGWGTSLALYALDVDTGAVRFVTDANGYQVIDRCKDKRLVGKLVLLEHRYFYPLPQSAVDWFFLRDERGTRLGIVGPEDHNVARLLARRCGVGQAPPPPPRQKPTGKLARGKVRCGKQQLSPAPITLLDGTTLDFVHLVDLEALAEDPDALPMLIDAESAASILQGDCR
ncbi:MAG: hypothetical protein WKG00_10565 [Polyangiaceae bacterium]